MNKKYKNMVLWISLGAMVLFSGITGYYLVQNISTQPNIKEDVTIDVNDPDSPDATPLHEHDELSEIEGKKDELEKEESLVLEDISFSKLTTHTRATAENTGATLLGATDKHLLIKAYGGLIYLYDLNRQDDFAVTKFGDYAILSKDDKYVFFTKFEEPIQKKNLTLYVHSLETSTQEEIAFIPDGFTVEDIIYENGIVTYIAKDMNYTQFISKEVIIPDFQKAYNVSTYESKDYPELEGELFLVGTKKFAYNYTQNKLFELKSGVGIVEKVQMPDADTISFANSFDMTENEQWVLVYSNEIENKNMIRTNNGVLTVFEDPLSAKFLTSNVILVNDGANLFLYNLGSQSKIEFLPNAARFFVHNDTISLQSTDGEIQSIQFKSN